MIKTILLTGATSGIGKSFTDLIKKREDIKLIIIGRDETKLDEIKGDNIQKYCADIRDEKEVRETLLKILKENKIDVLINNAGVGVPSELDSDDILEKYDLMMTTNTRAIVQITNLVLKQMKERNEGFIINVSSEAGLKSNPTAPLYCASKFAVEAYSDGLREQLKRDKYDIRVSVIRPGPIATNYWGSRIVPKEKFLQANEVASVLEYLINTPKTVTIKSIDLESNRK